jgi:hypothetical protein
MRTIVPISSRRGGSDGQATAVAGLLDNYSAMMGFPGLQQPMQPAQPMQQFPFAHIPQRPQPDLSGVHALTGQLMAKLIAPPVPFPQIQLPGTHAPSMAQTMQAANAVAGGTNAFWPGPFGQRQQ